MDHPLSAQQKCTIPTLEPPALLVTCQQPDIGLVSVTEWSLGDLQIPSKYTNFLLQKGKHYSKTIKYPSSRSCVKFKGDGTFASLYFTPVRLVEERVGHLCWGLPSGEVLLIGARGSLTTTERISTDGSSSSADFTLPYDTG